MATLKKFFADKIVVITGAAHGMGHEMVRIAAENHAIVWALDRDKLGIEELEIAARQQGWNVFTQHLDITVEADLQVVIQTIKTRSKRIDIWINNAGIQSIGTFLGMTAEAFDKIIDVNLLAVIKATRLVLNQMEKQGFGVILNMASTAGHVPSPFMAAYVTSKHGLVGFSKALQAEMNVLKLPIRVAFASPGFVDTAIIEKGKQNGFPNWLSWMLVDSKQCAKQILLRFARGENEIHPTISGTLMRRAYSMAPQTTVNSSKMFLSKGLMDFILNRYEVPR